MLRKWSLLICNRDSLVLCICVYKIYIFMHIYEYVYIVYIRIYMKCMFHIYSKNILEKKITSITLTSYLSSFSIFLSMLGQMYVKF
jgi:hypothetical protein